MPLISFPDGFLWGTATAAHQIEGGNYANDWWAFEHQDKTPCVEPSGDACDSWNRWSEDLDIVASLGLGAYRFSLEWSRIEPERGEWSRAALDHYRRICAACHDRGIVPIVTFHHFTSPRWFAALGGWESESAPDLFARFCERSVSHLGELIGWACTINEPNIVALMGYLVGVFPPGVSDVVRRRKVNEILCQAHRRGVEALRAGPGQFPVGLTLSMTDYQAVEGGEARRDRIRRSAEDVFLASTSGDDFIGVQTYTRSRIGPDGALPPQQGVPVTQMGYEEWPAAVGACVRRAWEVTGGTPVLVTETGIGTDDDARRVSFLRSALSSVYDCLGDGLDVRGFVQWSLLDNFEWALGYGPKFGIVEVDRTTFERRPKQSARWFGEVARRNAVEVDEEELS